MRRKRGQTIKQVSDALGGTVSADLLSKYERGEREAGYQVLISLADYYRVSVDEILGHDPKPANTLGQKIRELRLAQNLSMEEFIERIDGKPGKGRSGTVNNWEKGKNRPNKMRLKRIAQIAGVEPDEFLKGGDSSQ
nr:helix-turn-helix transcriptional regulator [Secundilactobacillus kimchicus]